MTQVPGPRFSVIGPSGIPMFTIQSFAEYFGSRLAGILLSGLRNIPIEIEIYSGISCSLRPPIFPHGKFLSFCPKFDILESFLTGYWY